MTKIWFSLPKAFVAVAVLAVVVVAACLQHLRFGQLPDGERQARRAHWPNFSKDIFVNQSDSPLSTTDQCAFAMWMATLFGQQGKLPL